jgi:hypothetical protein
VERGGWPGQRVKADRGSASMPGGGASRPSDDGRPLGAEWRAEPAEGGAESGRAGGDWRQGGWWRHGAASGPGLTRGWAV